MRNKTCSKHFFLTPGNEVIRKFYHKAHTIFSIMHDPKYKLTLHSFTIRTQQILDEQSAVESIKSKTLTTPDVQLIRSCLT